MSDPLDRPAAVSKYAEMNQAAQAARRSWLEARQRSWQYAATLVKELCSYCEIPNDRIAFLRWNGATGEDCVYQHPENGGRYFLPVAMRYNDETGFWHLGLSIVFDNVQSVFFAFCVADRDGRQVVKIGHDGNAKPIDAANPNQRNEFYDGIIEAVMQCYRDGKSSKRIGFSIAAQTDPSDESAHQLPAA